MIILIYVVYIWKFSYIYISRCELLTCKMQILTIIRSLKFFSKVLYQFTFSPVLYKFSCSISILLISIFLFCGSSLYSLGLNPLLAILFMNTVVSLLIISLFLDFYAFVFRGNFTFQIM